MACVAQGSVPAGGWSVSRCKGPVFFTRSETALQGHLDPSAVLRLAEASVVMRRWQFSSSRCSSGLGHPCPALQGACCPHTSPQLPLLPSKSPRDTGSPSLLRDGQLQHSRAEQPAGGLSGWVRREGQGSCSVASRVLWGPRPSWVTLCHKTFEAPHAPASSLPPHHLSPSPPTPNFWS